METSQLRPEDHWKQFKEFCKLETALKGPDPQLITLHSMCELDECHLYEEVWRAGLTMGVWNVPTAEMIWKAWPLERAMTEPEQMEDWLRTNWAGIFRRRERRCVNTVPKMTKYMQDLAAWLPKVFVMDFDYETYWNSVQDEIKFMGRYIALKFLEYLGRYCRVPIACPDIRADGGWSPVRSMGMMYTTMNDQIKAAPNNTEAVRIAENFASMTLKRLHIADIKINFFELQVMLCEYRTCYEHRHQYPGRSLDEELEFATKVKGAWPEFEATTRLYEARVTTFAPVALGELNSWNAIRKELGGCLRDLGYQWTDLVYDYAATTDLTQPARRIA